MMRLNKNIPVVIKDRVLRKYSGNIPKIFRKNPGKIPEKSRKNPGKIPERSRKKSAV
jgi:hypothetical protein